MNAMTLIRELKAAGLTLDPAPDGLHVTPKTRITPELREHIRAHKAEILAALQQPANDANDLDEAQAERAAIREHDGGINRGIAELLARHGDASAGGVDWTVCRLVADAQASRRWLVVTALGCTTLTSSEPRTRAEIMKAMCYSTALPIGEQP
ncbi:MAG: TubC N-terminal docking domain-related protein [Thiomonas sp.]